MSDKVLDNPDWAAALARLATRRGQYEELIGMPGVNVSFALTMLDQLKGRYDSGERCEQLHQEMMDVE